MSFESEMGSDMENVNITANGVISREIGEINLAYMLLAQKLVKQDRAEAMFRLGVGRDLADLLANMSLSQIVKLADSIAYLRALGQRLGSPGGATFAATQSLAVDPLTFKLYGASDRRSRDGSAIVLP